jgi:hypothetical protein
MQQSAKVAAPQSQAAKTARAPTAPAAPLPIDAALLRHISGGGPARNW